MVVTLFHVLLEVLAEVHQGLLHLTVKLSMGETHSGPRGISCKWREGALPPTLQARMGDLPTGRSETSGCLSGSGRGSHLSPSVHTNGRASIWSLRVPCGHPLPVLSPQSFL